MSIHTPCNATTSQHAFFKHKLFCYIGWWKRKKMHFAKLLEILLSPQERISSVIFQYFLLYFRVECMLCRDSRALRILRFLVRIEKSSQELLNCFYSLLFAPKLTGGVQDGKFEQSISWKCGIFHETARNQILTSFILLPDQFTK